jgi:hypothetical protein
MNSYVSGFAVITLTTILAVVGMLIVRRKVGLERLASYHEVAGYLLSVIGTLYAVLLGFIVVDAMNHLQEARVTVEQEANALADIFLIADGLESVRKEQIQSLCRKYAAVVIDEEWPLMRQGRFSNTAVITGWRLWKNVSRLQPRNECEQNLQQSLLTELGTMADNRRIRLINSKHGVAPIMWVVLIMGGIFTVVFTYFFGVKNVGAQILMTVLVSVTLSLNIFLVSLFGYPFSGDLAVAPEAFKLDQQIFERFLRETADISVIP